MTTCCGFLGWKRYIQSLLDADGVEGRQRGSSAGRNALIVGEANTLRDRYFSEGIADVTTCTAAATRTGARHLEIDARSKAV